MAEMALPIIKGDKIEANTDYRDSLPVNMIAISKKILNASGYLLSHPGLKFLGTGLGADRGGYWNERQEIHFRVSNTQLISVSASGAVAALGEITGSERASMTHSFNSQAVVADNRMWLFQNDGTFLEITDSDLGDPIDVTWIDGYYFLTDGEFIYHTNISDETQIDPLKFATAEFDPDPTLAVDTTSDNQVIVFGRYSTEYFINRATDNFAFQRIQGKAIKAGVVATHCETELEGSFYILGGGREEAPSVHVISAGTYTSIATREIDKLIAQYTETELQVAVLETRVEDRDKFVIVRLPGETLLYNATIARERGISEAWTIVKSGIDTDLKWRGVNGVYDPRISKFVYGDNQGTNIGILDNTIATQYGDQAETIFFTPFFNLESASIDYFDLDTIPGHQVNADQVNCFISLTYNGVIDSQEHLLKYGGQFKYDQRFIAYRLGYVADWAGIKIRTVSPERVAFSYCRIMYG